MYTSDESMRGTRSLAAALDGLASAPDVAGLRLRFELVTWVPLVGSTLPRPQALLLRKRGAVLRAELYSGGAGGPPTPPTTVLVLSAGGSERAPRGCWVLDARTKSATMATSAAWAVLDGSIGASNRRRLELAHQAVAPVIPVVTRTASDAMAWAQRSTSSLMDKASGVLTAASKSSLLGGTASAPDLPASAAAPGLNETAVDGAAASAASAVERSRVRATTDSMAMQLLPYIELMSVLPSGLLFGSSKITDGLAKMAVMLAAAPDEKDAAGKTPEPTKLDVPLGAGITLQMAVEEFALGEPAWESVEIPDDYRILS